MVGKANENIIIITCTYCIMILADLSGVIVDLASECMGAGKPVGSIGGQVPQKEGLEVIQQHKIIQQ